MLGTLPSWASQIASILAYSACSISMTLANKHLVGHLGFKAHILLLSLQSTVAVGTQLLGARFGIINDLNHPTIELARKWLPVNLCFIAMLYTSFLALGSLSMPVVTIFKNLTNIVITAGAWYLFEERVSIMLLGALFLLVVGAVLAGFADLSEVHQQSQQPGSADADGDSLFERLVGYVWMLLNCFTTATYVLYLRAASDFKGMSRQDQAFYNNAMAVPLSLLLSFVMGEMPSAMGAEQMSWPSFWVAVVFSGSVGFFLSLASLWCVGETGATTYSMVGALNKIPLSLIGMMLFGSIVKLSTVIFMGFGLSGGIVFAYVKAMEAQEDRRKSQAAAAAADATKGKGKGADSESGGGAAALALPGVGDETDSTALLGGEGHSRDVEMEMQSSAAGAGAGARAGAGAGAGSKQDEEELGLIFTAGTARQQEDRKRSEQMSSNRSDDFSQRRGSKNREEEDEDE